MLSFSNDPFRCQQRFIYSSRNSAEAVLRHWCIQTFFTDFCLLIQRCLVMKGSFQSSLLCFQSHVGLLALLVSANIVVIICFVFEVAFFWSSLMLLKFGLLFFCYYFYLFYFSHCLSLIFLCLNFSNVLNLVIFYLCLSAYPSGLRVLLFSDSFLLASFSPPCLNINLSSYFYIPSLSFWD